MPDHRYTAIYSPNFDVREYVPPSSFTDSLYNSRLSSAVPCQYESTFAVCDAGCIIRRANMAASADYVEEQWRFYGFCDTFEQARYIAIQGLTAGLGKHPIPPRGKSRFQHLSGALFQALRSRFMNLGCASPMCACRATKLAGSDRRQLSASLVSMIISNL